MISELTALSPQTGAALGFGLGLALGLLHFLSLRKVAELYLEGGNAVRAIGLQLTRMSLLVVALAGLALAGALPLLSGAAGLLAGRAVVLRRERRRP